MKESCLPAQAQVRMSLAARVFQVRLKCNCEKVGLAGWLIRSFETARAGWQGWREHINTLGWLTAVRGVDGTMGNGLGREV